MDLSLYSPLALFSVLVAVFNAALANAANTYNQGIATDQATAGAADQAATDAYNSAAQTALNTESTNDQTASW